MNNEAITTLTSMGFNESQALDALTECGGNLEQAIDFLLSGGVPVPVSNNFADDDSDNVNYGTTIIHSDTSQYSSSSGRSACTSIALTFASLLMGQIHNAESVGSTAPSIETIITSRFLSESITQGLTIYNELQTKNNSGVEHLSVEEILQLPTAARAFSSLNLLPNSPRQGILSSFNDNPLGLLSILSACQSDVTASRSRSYMAIVITKPPETVLVVIPSNNAAGMSSTQQSYVLIDSHPRPNLFAPHNPTGSYALFHPNLESLVTSLKEIFPEVDLGSDVNEMMAMMYNSFDVYPFE